MVVLELHGVDEVVMQKAADGWAAIQEDRGVAFDAAEVHPGVLRLSAAHAVGCERIPAEMAPSGHTLPGPETPLPRESRIGQDDPALLDDWGIGRQLQETDEGALEQEGGLGCTYGDGVALPMDTGAGDLFGKQTRNHALGGLMLPPRGPSGGGGGQNGARNARQAHSHIPREMTGSARYKNVAPKPKKRRTSGHRNGDTGLRTARAYRGGRAEDELPDGGIDILSDDGEMCFTFAPALGWRGAIFGAPNLVGVSTCHYYYFFQLTFYLFCRPGRHDQ